MTKPTSATNILGYTLTPTCGSFPEQYDVTKDGQEVGFLHLRYSRFRAFLTEGLGASDFREVYAGTLDDSDWRGEFTDEERLRYLWAGVDALSKARPLGLVGP